MKKLRFCVYFLIGFIFSSSCFAATKIQFWHSMGGALGAQLNAFALQFNQLHPEYQIIPIYKGDYNQTLAAGAAAYRTGDAPTLLQVYEVGTAIMMNSRVVIPVEDLFAHYQIPFDQSSYMSIMRSYYSDTKTGHLMSIPFNSSVPVLYYNKNLFQKAGLDPDQPPKTWQQLYHYAEKLKQAGVKCPYTTGWMSWIQLENYSAWNGLPFASDDNGMAGLQTQLLFNQSLQISHIGLLQKMNQNHLFVYYGRESEADQPFYTGQCAILTTSSGSLSTIAEYAKFPFGVGQMPYDEVAKDAPQNAIIGGASLWVMKGKTAPHYQGAALFLAFLMQPENVKIWHEKTGYLPAIQSAYNLAQQQGYYTQNPNAKIAVEQLFNKEPLSYTRGLRLGYLPQIRTIIAEELESVWSGKKNSRQALDEAVKRGNILLRRFEMMYQ